jgi:hypothetical protein
VDKVRRQLLVLYRQGYPTLNTMQSGELVNIGAGALRVHNTASRHHKIDRARPNGLLHPQAISMHDLTFK